MKISFAKTAQALAISLVTFIPTLGLADDFDAAPTLDDASLDQLRGGFLLDNGVTVGLGAIVRTTIDGKLALETELSWQQQGAVISQQIGEGLAPSDSLTKTVTLPGKTQPFVLPEAETAIIHRVTDGSIQNIILNTASNRTIRQETDVTLTLTGFQPVQQQITAEHWSRNLASDLAIASQGALSR